MSDRTQSCADRIEGELSSTVESLRELFDRADHAVGDDQDDAYEQLDALSVSVKRVYTILMSTGGPADWFEATVDDGEIDRIEYVFQDWFDGARRELREGTPEWDAAHRYCSYMIEAMGDA